MLKNSILFISIIFIVLIWPVKNDSLSAANFANNVVSVQVPIFWNPVGLSMYFQETYLLFANPLFQYYINNSRIWGLYLNNFYQGYHVPIGYKYGCNPSLFNVTNSSLITCIYDLSLNTTITAQMKNFFANYGDYYGIDLGWDMQRANFTNKTSTYVRNFITYQNIFYSAAHINMEVIDYGDQLSSILGTNYTVSNFTSYLASIKAAYSGLYFTGPGITQNADSSWISQLATISNNNYCTFTFRFILFLNSSLATISNLLNDTYSKGFLNSVLIYPNGTLINMTKYYIGINQMKITNDSGINGITNSFAAALWAIDISAAFTTMGGRFINFYNSLNVSYQSVLGKAPYFSPGALYHGLLFAIYALSPNPTLSQYPIFTFATVIPGLSSNIKIYGFSFSSAYRVLIINKDINPNLNGTVDLVLPYTNGISCIYLQANNLSSTSGVSMGGIQFIPNSTSYLGNYHNVVYRVNGTGFYNINLSYAQAVVCDTIPLANQTAFPRGRSNLNYEQYHIIYICMLSAIIVLLNL